MTGPLSAILTFVYGPIEPPEPDPLFTVARTILTELPHLRGRDHMHTVMGLTYLCAMMHLGRTGETLFPDRFEATAFGPVIPRLHADLRRHVPRCLSDTHDRPLGAGGAGTVRELCRDAGDLTRTQQIAIMQRSDSGWGSTYRHLGSTDRGPVMRREALLADYRRLAA